MAAEHELVGRDAECSAIDHLLADAAAQRSGCLLLEGEVGAGKSALLGYAAARAGEPGTALAAARRVRPSRVRPRQHDRRCPVSTEANTAVTGLPTAVARTAGNLVDRWRSQGRAAQILRVAQPGLVVAVVGALIGHS